MISNVEDLFKTLREHSGKYSLGGGAACVAEGREDPGGNEITEVEAGSGEIITGTTSLAPGTEIELPACATGDTPVLLSQMVEAASDRTFETDFVFSDRPVGLEYEVTAGGPTGVEEKLDAVIVESSASETPEPTEAPEKTEPPEETAEPTATPTEEPEATEAPGQPGFRVIVTLIAFMTAEPLATKDNKIPSQF